jgi:hypothetical protein
MLADIELLCFDLNTRPDGIRTLDFGEDPKSIDIYGMVSGEGERVSLGKNLKARGNVENWLTSVEQNMVQSMRRCDTQLFYIRLRIVFFRKVICTQVHKKYQFHRLPSSQSNQNPA